jgi:DHA3 family tetracycline resistance protein-like MFS transporter
MRQASSLYAAIIERLRLVQAFRSRPFTLLWIGQTISVIGDAVFSIAITWEILLLNGTATAISLILLAQWGPKIVFLLLSGVIADRVSRRVLLLCADIGRGCIVLCVAWLSWSHQLQFWHLVALAPLFGIVSSFFDPAYQAIVPQLVEPEQLTSVNSLNTLSRNIGFLLGPVPGALCVALFGMASAFAFDALTYGISALCLLALRLPSSATSSQTSGTAHLSQANDQNASSLQGLRAAIRDAHDGLRYVFSFPWLWVTVLASPLVGAGFAGAMWVSLPRLVRDVYGAGVWLIGAVATADAVGSILAALFLGSTFKLRRGVTAYGAVLVGGCALMSCALPLPRPMEPLIVIGASALVGAALATFTILWGTLQQEKVPNDKLGRVSSITQLGVASTLPGGLILAGLLADHIGPAQVFALCGLLVVLPASIGLCVRDIRQLQ